MAYKSLPVDNVIALRLLMMLCTPFNEFPAYKAGIIDDKGKYLIPAKKRTSQQKKCLTYLDKLIINVKKLLNKLPGGENKLKNIVSAMVLIKESVENHKPECMIDADDIAKVAETYNPKDPKFQQFISVWSDYIKLKEEMGTGAIASGPTNTTSGVAMTQLPMFNKPFRRVDHYGLDQSDIFSTIKQ